MILVLERMPMPLNAIKLVNPVVGNSCFKFVLLADQITDIGNEMCVYKYNRVHQHDQDLTIFGLKLNNHELFSHTLICVSR